MSSAAPLVGVVGSGRVGVRGVSFGGRLNSNIVVGGTARYLVTKYGFGGVLKSTLVVRKKGRGEVRDGGFRCVNHAYVRMSKNSQGGLVTYGRLVRGGCFAHFNRVRHDCTPTMGLKAFAAKVNVGRNGTIKVAIQRGVMRGTPRTTFVCKKGGGVLRCGRIFSVTQIANSIKTFCDH